MRALYLAIPQRKRANGVFVTISRTDLEDTLRSNARDGVQTLLGSLFSLPIAPSSDGPLAQLPPPTTPLPRAKPLPKPKLPTKWERFAAAKGIQHKKRDRKVWDEERQQWTNRWGREGKNKQIEDQWLTEVPRNAGESFFPAIFFSPPSRNIEQTSNMTPPRLLARRERREWQRTNVSDCKTWPHQPQVTKNGGNLRSKRHSQQPASAPQAWAGLTINWRAKRNREALNGRFVTKDRR